MKRLTTFGWAAILLGALLSVTACGGGKEIEKAKVDEVLTVLRGDESAILDPHGTDSGGDANLIQQMYEGLVRASEQAPVQWEPCLAESWTISQDGKTYTFLLRPGVRFHDGEVCNASAVKRSFDRCRNAADPAGPPDLPYAKDYFGVIDSIDTPDAATIVFHLARRDPKFLASCGMFSSSVVSPKAIKTMEKETDSKKREHWLTTHPAGTGPFTVAQPEDYKDAATISMTAFDEYWGGKPAIKTVVFKQASDPKSRREQLIANEVQVVDSPAPEDWADLEKDTGVVLHSWKAENLCYLAMNCDPAAGFPTSDLRVRQAIAMAVDRAPLVSLYADTAVEHHVLLPPVTYAFPQGYVPQTDRGPRADRLKEARRLVKEAGAEGAKLQMIFPNKSRPYLGKPDQVADLLRQQLAEIGITVELAKDTMANLQISMRDGKAPLVLIGWMGETGEPDDFWRPLLSGSDGKPANFNAARFFVQEVADKVDAALLADGREKRKALYEELEKSVHDKYRPMVPLLSAMQADAWRSEVEGIFVDSTGVYRLYKAHYKEK